MNLKRLRTLSNSTINATTTAVNATLNRTVGENISAVSKAMTSPTAKKVGIATTAALGISAASYGVYNLFGNDN